MNSWLFTQVLRQWDWNLRILEMKGYSYGLGGSFFLICFPVLEFFLLLLFLLLLLATPPVVHHKVSRCINLINNKIISCNRYPLCLITSYTSSKRNNWSSDTSHWRIWEECSFACCLILILVFFVVVVYCLVIMYTR